MSRRKKSYNLPILEGEDDESDSLSSRESVAESEKNAVPLTSWRSEYDLRVSKRKASTKNLLSLPSELGEVEDPSYESIGECSAEHAIVNAAKPFVRQRKHREKEDGQKTSGAVSQNRESMQRCRSEEILRVEPVYESVVDAKGKGARKRSSGAASSLEAVKGYFARLTGHPAPMAAQSSESVVDDATQTDSDEGVNSEVSLNTLRLEGHLRGRPLPRRPSPSLEASIDSASSRNSEDCSNSDYESLCDLKIHSLWQGSGQPASRPRSCIETHAVHSYIDLNFNAVRGDDARCRPSGASPAMRSASKCHYMSMQELNWKELSTASLSVHGRGIDSGWCAPRQADSFHDGIRCDPGMRLPQSSVLATRTCRGKLISERSVTPQSLKKTLSDDVGLERVDATRPRSLLNDTWASKEHAAGLCLPILESENDRSSHRYVSFRNSSSFFRKRNSYPAPGMTENRQILLFRKTRRRVGSAGSSPTTTVPNIAPQVNNRASGIRRWITGSRLPRETKLELSSPLNSRVALDTPCDCPHPTKRHLCPTCGAVTDNNVSSSKLEDDGDRLVLMFALYVVLMAVRISAALFASLMARYKKMTMEQEVGRKCAAESRSDTHEYEEVKNFSRAKTLRYRLKDGTKRLLSQSRKILTSKGSKLDLKNRSGSIGEMPAFITGMESLADVFDYGDANRDHASSSSRKLRAISVAEPVYTAIHNSYPPSGSIIHQRGDTARQHRSSSDSKSWPSGRYRRSGSFTFDRRYEDPDVVPAESKPPLALLNSQLSYLLSSKDWGSLQICYDDDQYLVPLDLSASPLNALARADDE